MALVGDVTGGPIDQKYQSDTATGAVSVTFGDSGIRGGDFLTAPASMNTEIVRYAAYALVAIAVIILIAKKG